LFLGNGFYGVKARLERTASGWSGWLRNHTDGGRSEEHERALRLESVSCDSPPPIAASDDRPLPRVVELSGGEVLELGELLPEGLATEPRGMSGGLTVRAQTSGMFAGADTIIVRLAPRTGRIAGIELRYPLEFDLDIPLRAIVREFGRPGANRTTTVSAMAREAQNLPRLVLSDPRFGFGSPW
jgi:hypothetical protein